MTQLLSAIMSDVLEERLTHNAANAVVNAAGKLLKVVELQARFSSTGRMPNHKVLTLVTDAQAQIATA